MVHRLHSCLCAESGLATLCFFQFIDQFKCHLRSRKKKRLSKSNFKYAVGIDPQAKMKNAFGISAIPHVAVISSDGVVRWQGHPMSLNPQTMNELIAANRALLAKSGGGGGSANRWQKK
jgi:hypothetical protein